LVWHELDPVVLDVRSHLAVLLDESIIFSFIFVSSTNTGFIIFLHIFSDFEMGQEVEVLRLRFTSRRWEEIVDRLILDLGCWQLVV